MRSKGRIWIASDHTNAVEWSQAGVYTTLKAASKWLPLGEGRRCWPETAKAKFNDKLYGDRRQELVLIGIFMDKAAIRDSLDGAIVTDEEFALGPELWTSWAKLMMELTLIPEDEGRGTEFSIDLVKTDSGSGGNLRSDSGHEHGHGHGHGHDDMLGHGHGHDDALGVLFDDTEGIRITGVKEDGLLHKWNAENMSANPELVVRVGYSIVSVNGVKGVHGMELISSNTHLRITISRLFLIALRKRFPF